jgi:hypothetical protein
MKRVSGVLMMSLLACSTEQAEQVGEDDADVTVSPASAVPMDATCAHITLTRLSDFSVTEFKGALSGAHFKAKVGDAHVTATAYPAPCSNEPAQPAWLADEKIATLVGGPNVLALMFRRNVDVSIDPTFEGDPQPVAIQPGSQVRTGRNGEDAAGPDFSLDGFEVKQIALPPAAPSETVLFSTEGKPGIPYSPRGMAHLSDGRFVFQVAEMNAPLAVMDAAGNFLETWANAAPGALAWTNTDGLEAVTDTHFVRTGFADPATGCDATGENCTNAGLDILALNTAPDGSHFLTLETQIRIPAPFNGDYPVGVTPVGPGQFTVALLPAEGNTRFITIDSLGNLLAGPEAAPGDVEGLFVDATGRLVTMDYQGHVATYNLPDLSPRGETASYTIGVDASNVFGLAWRDAGTGNYIMLTSDQRILGVSPDVTSAVAVGIDPASIAKMSGIDYRAAGDELVAIDRLPPVDPVSGTRIPLARRFSLATNAQTAATLLEPGVPLPLRCRTIGFANSTQQYVTHYRRPAGVVDAGLDAMVFVHNLDGTLARSFDLRPFGFTRILSVDVLPSDEIAVQVVDITGARRLAIAGLDGTPHRSVRLDGLFAADFAAVTTGPFAGSLAATLAQPSFLLRVDMP